MGEQLLQQHSGASASQQLCSQLLLALTGFTTLVFTGVGSDGNGRLFYSINSLDIKAVVINPAFVSKHSNFV